MIDFINKTVTAEELATTLNQSAIYKDEGRSPMLGALSYPLNDNKTVSDLLEANIPNSPVTCGLLSSEFMHWLVILLMSFYEWRIIYKYNDASNPDAEDLTEEQIDKGLAWEARAVNSYLGIFARCPHCVGEIIARFAKIIGINQEVHPFENLKLCDTFEEIFQNEKALTEICECFLIWDMIAYMYLDDLKNALSNFPEIKLYLIKDGYCFPEDNQADCYKNMSIYTDVYRNINTNGFSEITVQQLACFRGMLLTDYAATSSPEDTVFGLNLSTFKLGRRTKYHDQYYWGVSDLPNFSNTRPDGTCFFMRTHNYPSIYNSTASHPLRNNNNKYLTTCGGFEAAWFCREQFGRSYLHIEVPSETYNKKELLQNYHPEGMLYINDYSTYSSIPGVVDEQAEVAKCTVLISAEKTLAGIQIGIGGVEKGDTGHYPLIRNLYIDNISSEDNED